MKEKIKNGFIRFLEFPKRKEGKRKYKVIEITAIPCVIIVLFMFCYQVVYQWYIVSQWDTMHVILKIVLGILFIVMIFGIIIRIIQQILFVKNNLHDMY